MFTGKIEGLKIAKSLGRYPDEIPREWEEKAAVLKTKPGPIATISQEVPEQGVMPIFHCYQEVPCNPCTSVCPEKAIRTREDKITGLPYMTDLEKCKGCMACVAICPGLAITLVDYRKDEEGVLVTLSYEIWRGTVEKGSLVPVTDDDGAILGQFPVERVISNKKKHPGTLLVQIKMDRAVAQKAVGIRVQEEQVEPSEVYEKGPLPDEAIICRCERVNAGEIREAIRNGVRDINHLKAINRAGMGACGSKTCRPMIWRIFQEEGIDIEQVTDRIDRPLFVEVPLGTLANVQGGESNE